MALDESGIKYLIVGGIAVAYHGAPRFTKDLDVLVRVSAPDNTCLFQCLKEFGAPVYLVTEEEFLQEDFIFHFGSPPWRIDILTSVPGVDFAQAYMERIEVPFGDYKASFISREWLIRSKKASGRPQDLLDIESLSG